MASFLSNLRDRAQAGLQRGVQAALDTSELTDEEGNLLNVGVNVDVKLDTKTTAIAIAIALAAAVCFVLIKKLVVK